MDTPSKEAPQACFSPLGKQRSSFRRFCIFFVLLFLVILVAAAVLVPTVLIPKLRDKDKPSGSTIKALDRITLACNVTRFPDTCKSTIVQPTNAESDSIWIPKLAVDAAANAVTSTLSRCRAYNLDPQVIFNATHKSIVDDCLEILQYGLEYLTSSSEAISKFLGPEQNREPLLNELKTWASGALTFTRSCSDGLSRIQTVKSAPLRQQVNQTLEVVSNALAIVNSYAVYGDDLEKWRPAYFLGDSRGSLTTSARRMLLSTDDSPQLKLRRSKPSSNSVGSCENSSNDICSSLNPSSLNVAATLPNWLRPQDRRLLLGESFPVPNITVAQDGSGNYTTIQEAVNAAPVNSNTRFIIYIKLGVYDELVKVPFQTKNVMFLGDGINQTIITGNLSVQSPDITTFKSATVGVAGEGFMARGLTILNTAGAEAQQAVALRVSADKCALWQCSLHGFQDTLWAHAFRQFYKDCTISGTVDFVFGNAAAVLQSCTLLARVNLPGKQNVYTAQGRTDPGQWTGFSIQNCTLDGTPDLLQLNSSSQQFTYLGRPWKQYSLTVIIKSDMSAIIDSAGWLPYSGDFAFSTLFYGEYANTGPGANTEARVKWSTAITDSAVVAKFQVGQFLHSTTWLSSTGIPYADSL